jgi:hypothetical protein
MLLRITDVRFAVTECRTRIPFRFGAATMTAAPLCTAELTVEAENGARARGWAADLLAPKWFDKDPAKSMRRNALDLAQSARAAATAFTTAAPESVFEHWLRVYGERVGEVPSDAPDRLVRGFGVALCERALIDAACRAAEVSFFDALASDLFGFRPAALHAELAGWSLARGLGAPLDSIRVRHTVGMADALRAADVPADVRVRDGFPQALDEDVAAYGLTAFKIKLGGDREQDAERLLDVARALDAAGIAAPLVTLDANEQYADLAQLAALFEGLRAHADGRALLAGLAYVEQPLPRAMTLEPESNADLARVAAFAPLLIDEADTGPDSFPRALDLGYRGVSVKNCKGVFRALVNRGLCEVRAGGAFQSSEDLTNLPVLALQQDLATAAALGLAHSERNGHHYFAGLAHLPTPERAAARRAHATLYRDGDALAIRAGALDVTSLACPGYGHAVPPDLDARTPLAAWESA